MGKDGIVTVDMTLTSMGCLPLAGMKIVEQVENALREIPEINATNVNIVWNPPWSKDRMSEDMQKLLLESSKVRTISRDCSIGCLIPYGTVSFCYTLVVSNLTILMKKILYTDKRQETFLFIIV